MYIRSVLTGSSSLDAVPVTGSLLFYTPVCCLAVCGAAEFSSKVLFGGTIYIWLAGRELFFRQVGVSSVMMADSAAAAEGRAGITFDVELVIPWDAPEAVVDLQSDILMDLETVPDVIGLTGRRPEAAVCRILQGRDVRSVRVLVPDSRGLERNFHDVTIVDMGDLPEVSVSMAYLSMLRRQWLATVLCQDLDTLRAEARKRFRNARPGKCSECHKWIKCNMYRHVATYHLDLAQLWRCPVSWCTVWKGTPQGCMDHVRGAHDVPWDAKSPWTVRRQVWSDSLAANHSGISTDVLLFSDIHLSLTHHYQVHKRGLPHIAFRKNYLPRLRVSVSQAAGRSRRDTTSPVASSPVSTRHASENRRRPDLPDVAVVGCGQFKSWRNWSVSFRR